jgi:hypothetical protein
VTTPKINTIKRGGSRLYVHPETADKVPGVTSVLNMLPKEFLKFWAAKVVAETAVENLGSIVGLAMGDPQGAVDYLKRAPMRNTGAAADMGTTVHDMYERLAKGEDVGRVTPDLKPYLAIYRDFEEKFQPEFLHIEDTFWSETHGYAGSADWIGNITDPDTGERVTAIGDWKTTRSGVHEETSLQLTAYSRADYIISPDGSKVELPKITAGVVVHARPEGGQVVPARIDDDVFDVFLNLLSVYKYEKELKKTLLGNGIPLSSEVKRGLK